MTAYDHSVIVAFADKLYAQAATIVATYTVLGAIVGGGIGAGIGTQFPGRGGLIALVAAVLIGAIAFEMGRQRAFQLRLQAQIALCQVQIEVNTRSV